MSGEALAPGDVVAKRYEIIERLGRGATGVVYRAAQPAFGREVALKVLHQRYAADPVARARFAREARVASALRHPSAVAVFDFGEEDGVVFLAMELLAGRTLRARLDEAGGGLDVSELIDIGAQIADVLTTAHELPLVHRDLKPGNVFLVRSADVGKGATVRVVDFGLAFIAGEARADRMTALGVVTGTPAYISPEQARGGEVGPATDVYALGCMLYELVSGRVPFAGNDMEVLTKQMFAAAPPLRHQPRPEPIPTALDRLIVSMLQKRPAERPTALEVRAALAELDPAAGERARDDSYLMGRGARMVGPGRDWAKAALPGDGVEVAVVGPVSADLWVSLAANGIVAWAADDRELSPEHIVFAPGIEADAMTLLVARGLCVVSDTDAGDIGRIQALLSAGAAEVVVRPVGADDLARRLHRIGRRRSRGRGR